MSYNKSPVFDPNSVIKCCSLDLILPSWTGKPTCRIRRASDNAQTDCYALPDGSFNKYFAKTFSNGSNIYLVTMYDQTGTGNNANQVTAAQQPQIILDSEDNVIRVLYRQSLESQMAIGTGIIEWSTHDWSVSLVCDCDTWFPYYNGIITNRRPANIAAWWTLGYAQAGAYPGSLTVEWWTGGAPVYLQSTGLSAIGNQPFYPYAKGLRHYVITKSTISQTSGVINLYVNGQLAGSTTLTYFIGNDVQSELWIGNWYGTGQSWNGHISDVMVFNKCLQPGEI